MNLIKQFPDVSMARRAKFKMKQKNYRAATANAEIPFDKEKAIASFYDQEFRKRHVKLALIITVLLGSIYFLALNSFGFFN